MDEQIIPITDLKRCLNCLVSVEPANSEDSYQGKVVEVRDDMNLLVLTKPFKTGRPMTPPKYPIYVSPNDVVKIIEPAVPESTTTFVSKPMILLEQKKMPPTQRFTTIQRDHNQYSPDSSRKPDSVPRTYKALELLNRAQQQSNQKSPNQQLTQAMRNLHPFQRIPNSPRTAQSQNNGGGPSGNPIMDLLNGHVRKGKHDFDQPIDMNELNQDFDFDFNLALFSKDEEEEDSTADIYIDREEEELEDFPPIENGRHNIVYEDKSAPNFRHDENIIKDPKRVTSWVNKAVAASRTKELSECASPSTAPTLSFLTKKQQLTQNVSRSNPNKKEIDSNGAVDEYSSLRLKAFGVLPTDNGSLLPVLKKTDKQHLLEATNRLYSHHIYSIVIGDRFTEYVFDLQRRLSITEKEMLIIAGPSCNPVILHRFMQHFYNRKIKLHVYDPPPIPGHLENKTLSYQDVMDLPIDLPAIYILCDKTFHTDEGLRRWILRLSRPSQTKTSPQKCFYPRLVGLDFRLFDVKHMHTLYLGAADESATTQTRSDSMLCTFEATVADLGTPYSWISGAEAMSADAFRNSLSCRLIVT